MKKILNSIEFNDVNYFFTIVTNVEKHDKKRKLLNLPFYNCLDKDGYEWEVVMNKLGVTIRVFKTGKKFKKQETLSGFDWKKMKNQYVTTNQGQKTGLIKKIIIWKEIKK
jgi:hypothetical protein